MCCIQPGAGTCADQSTNSQQQLGVNEQWLNRRAVGTPASDTSIQGTGGVPIRRCRALYDCEADNDDELSFHEGEVILVLNEHTDDENWMEGVVETDPSRRGMFPISFVHMLPD